jgi:hypothetical protein
MAKQQSVEKKVSALRQQLIGKAAHISSTSPKGPHYTLSQSGETGRTDSVAAEMSYLKKDLLRICILSTMAVGVEIGLYIAIHKGMVHIPFIG